MTNNYTLEDIKKEIFYHTGKKRISNDEAKEILYFYKYNQGHTSLGEIISDYYAC